MHEEWRLNLGPPAEVQAAEHSWGHFPRVHADVRPLLAAVRFMAKPKKLLSVAEKSTTGFPDSFPAPSKFTPGPEFSMREPVNSTTEPVNSTTEPAKLTAEPPSLMREPELLTPEA